MNTVQAQLSPGQLLRLLNKPPDWLPSPRRGHQRTGRTKTGNGDSEPEKPGKAKPEGPRQVGGERGNNDHEDTTGQSETGNGGAQGNQDKKLLPQEKIGRASGRARR